MYQEHFKVPNKQGIHLSPAFEIARYVSGYNSDHGCAVEISRVGAGIRHDATSVLSLVQLRASKGTYLTVFVTSQQNEESLGREAIAGIKRILREDDCNSVNF